MEISDMESDETHCLKLFPMEADSVVWESSRRGIQRNIVVTVESSFMSKEKRHKEWFHPEIFRAPET